MISIKISKLQKDAIIPKIRTKESAGYDVCAYLSKPISVHPMERVVIPTGLALEIPSGYYLSVRPRSSLALHHGITLSNAPGTIDSDYRGELMILIINLGEKKYLIQHNDAIAQLLLKPVYEINFIESKLSTFSQSERGSGRFGSTGR